MKIASLSLGNSSSEIRYEPSPFFVILVDAILQVTSSIGIVSVCLNVRVKLNFSTPNWCSEVTEPPWSLDAMGNLRT